MPNKNQALVTAFTKDNSLAIFSFEENSSFASVDDDCSNVKMDALIERISDFNANKASLALDDFSAQLYKSIWEGEDKEDISISEQEIHTTLSSIDHLAIGEFEHYYADEYSAITGVPFLVEMKRGEIRDIKKSIKESLFMLFNIKTADDLDNYIKAFNERALNCVDDRSFPLGGKSFKTNIPSDYTKSHGWFDINQTALEETFLRSESDILLAMSFNFCSPVKNQDQHEITQPQAELVFDLSFKTSKRYDNSEYFLMTFHLSKDEFTQMIFG